MLADQRRRARVELQGGRGHMGEQPLRQHVLDAVGAVVRHGRNESHRQELFTMILSIFILDVSVNQRAENVTSRAS